MISQSKQVGVIHFGTIKLLTHIDLPGGGLTMKRNQTVKCHLDEFAAPLPNY